MDIDAENRFNIYSSIIESHITELIQIYLNEKNKKGIGMLFIDFSNKEKMDVMYNPLYDNKNDCINDNFPEKLSKLLNDYKGPSSIIFFNIFDNEGNIVLSIDLDKNNKFIKSE